VSTALGIAAVTAVIRNLLDNGLIDDQVTSAVGNVAVTALAPDLIPLDKNGASQLNLFLYQVTPNPGWRNVGLPSRDASGERLTNPPLALDLHYLLTAYASKDLHAEILLGYGMQLLHETPVLARPAIRRTLRVPGLVSDPGAQLPPELERIGACGLAEQVEAIKITPATMGTEELSKLWAAFQSRYRPSAAYLATVVLIEAERPTRSPLPVRVPKLYVVPFQEPVIEQVLHQDVPGGPSEARPPMLARHRLVLRGRRLKEDRVRVRIGPRTVEPDPADVSAEQVVVASLAGLPAGVHSVQVIHDRLMGEPPAPHPGVSSNLVAFVLHPEIVAPVVSIGPGLLRVTVDPPVEPMQRVELVLNERSLVLSPPVNRPLRSYSFVVPPRPLGSPSGPVSEIEVPVPGVVTGTYLVRVRVDGAESPLETDTAGAYASPTVTIP
jgi:hypothetical protein